MNQRSIFSLSAIAALVLAVGDARAFDDAKYPDLRGQWVRAPGGDLSGNPNNPKFDPNKPPGRGQQAPLIPEYQAIFEANAELAADGADAGRRFVCVTPGMPSVMQVYQPMEIVVTPDMTHIMMQNNGVHRRIFTDGRDWPEAVEPSFLGYSIGKWIDEDGNGRYNVLEVESRGFKGPRLYDASGLPLHLDNESVIKERFYFDKVDRSVLHDEITVVDHALTRPWTVLKSYGRNPDLRPVWHETECNENNEWVLIGKEGYMMSADGLLMPVKKDQRPPDLRYFNQSRK